jgi:hypothetical protein
LSGKLMGEVYKLDLPRAERDVLLALADHANDDGGECYPGVDLLAWKTDFSTRHVERSLRQLEIKGIAVPVANSKGGRGQKTEYKIDISKAKRKPELGIKKKPETLTSDVILLEPETLTFDAQQNPDICDKRVTFETERVTFETQKGDICDIAYKEEPPLEPSIEPPTEREAPAPEGEFLDSFEQVEIYERYYPGLSSLLSIYQREILGTMQNLTDCEAAIRYAAGNGIRGRSVDKIVNQVFKNREWERGRNGTVYQNGNGSVRESASARNAREYLESAELLARP